MEFRRLFIWVEGEDDERFFNRIVKPVFEKRYGFVEVRSYRQRPKNHVCRYLRSIKAMNADCIFVGDINQKPCITAKKQALQVDYTPLDQENIVVVRREIESWYLAGLDDPSCRMFKIRSIGNTDDITKEDFENLLPKPIHSRLILMSQILNSFSFETAIQKNRSFGYFVTKWKCHV